MTGPWKAWKAKTRLPTLSTALEIGQNQAIPTFPSASPTIYPIQNGQPTPARKPLSRGPNQGVELGRAQCSCQTQADGTKVRILMRQIVRKLREATRTREGTTEITFQRSFPVVAVTRVCRVAWLSRFCSIPNGDGLQEFSCSPFPSRSA